MGQVLRSLQARGDFIRIRQGLGKADGGGGVLRFKRLGLKPCASAFGSHQAAQGIKPIDCLSFQLVPELHSVLVSRKSEGIEGNVEMGSGRSERALDLEILMILDWKS